MPMALETRLTAECLYLASDFAQDIVAEWKAWLTGSAPMATIAILSLIDPDWVRLPIWTWAILIFVGGLVFAMFHVYSDLRRERDGLRGRIAGGISGPFLLVPYYGAQAGPERTDARLEKSHDL